MSWRTDLYTPAGLEGPRAEPAQGRSWPEVQGNPAQPPSDIEHSDAVEEISSPTLFRCWLSPSSLATLASCNHQTDPNLIGSSVDNLENQSAPGMKPQCAPKGCFNGNKSNPSHPNQNTNPFGKNSTNSDQGPRPQEDAELEPRVIGEDLHSQNQPNTPLNLKGLQLIDLLASSSTDSSPTPTNCDPDSKLTALSDVTEGTGLKIERVFSFNDYQFVHGELQQTMTHWTESDSKKDGGFSGDSDDSSIRDSLSYKEPATSPVTQLSAQQSPPHRPQPTDHLKHASHSYRCSVCQKTLRSLTTLQLHLSSRNPHNPSFTQYLKKESPFSERPPRSCQGQAAGPQERGSQPALPFGPNSPKQSLPIEPQPLSSTSPVNSLATDRKVSPVVCSGEEEDTGLPKQSAGLRNTSHATPDELQPAEVPKEGGEELTETLLGEPHHASDPEDVPLEVSPRRVPTDPAAPGQASTQQAPQGAGTFPKYHSKSYWSLSGSLRTLRLHGKLCKRRKISRRAQLSSRGPLPDQGGRVPDCPTSERCQAAESQLPGPGPGPPALWPPRFIPMSSHFYLALAGGHNYHVCNICELWCPDEASLDCHLKVHFWRRNHLCCLCDRAFHTQSSCWRHEARHRSHPRYLCAKCGRTFSCYKTLKQHMRQAHEVDLQLSDNDSYQEAMSKAATYRMI